MGSIYHFSKFREHSLIKLNKSQHIMKNYPTFYLKTFIVFMPIVNQYTALFLYLTVTVYIV